MQIHIPTAKATNERQATAWRYTGAFEILRVDIFSCFSCNH